MEALEEILYSDHKSFIFKFDSYKLLKTKLSPHSRSKFNNNYVDFTKICKEVEDRIKKEKFKKMVDKYKTEDDHNEVDKKFCKIIKDTYKKLKPP